MLSRASLKNPYAVLAICMIVFRAVSYQKMRVDIFPEIKIATILVTRFYRSLSPKEIRDPAYFTVRQQIAAIPVNMMMRPCEEII